MRFKLDENMPVEVAELLSHHGYEASTVFDEELSGASDARLALICQTEERILITLDLDFADIRSYPPRDCPGMIVLRLKRTDKRYILEFIPRLLELIDQELLVHRLWIVDEEKVRIRS